MYRYVGFIWNPDDVAAGRAAAFFGSQIAKKTNRTRRLDLTGITVFGCLVHAPAISHYVLPDGAGIILGRLFPRNSHGWSPVWHATISEREALKIVETGGSHLVETYWGGYIAFLRDDSSRRCYAIRDCSGRIPCYRTEAYGVEIVFSDIEDLDELGLPPLTINWRYLASFIYHSQLQIRDTGVKEVTELLAGDRLTVGIDGRTQDVLWDPRRFCTDDLIENVQEAAELLRAATQESVCAWASIYGTILLGLSGGFDSAVVLGCLSRSPFRPKIHCLNRFNDEWAGNERSFARIAAAQAGVELTESPWASGTLRIDDRLLHTQNVAKPHVPGLLGHLDIGVRNDVGRRVNADAFWTGEGGDHIFFQMKSTLGVADYLRSHGLGRHLLRVVRDSARLSKISYWRALYTGLSEALSGSKPGTDARTRGGGFLTGDVLDRHCDKYLEHPWLAASDDLPRGKRLQIEYLSAVLNRERPLADAEAVHSQHPLLSQPLLELCLRIPVYLLIKDGKPRGLARTAFTDIVPQRIVDREIKGTTTMYTLQILRESRQYISSILLDGRLVKEGILSAAALEPCVAHSRPLRGDQLFPLLASITAEMWIRRESLATRR